jgi:membrane-bound lytic murein transglycosylase B
MNKLIQLLPLILLPALVHGQDNEMDEQDFGVCIAGFQQQARQESISERVIEDVVGNLQPITRVVELDRSQPEFVQTFAHYLNLRVSEARIEKGRELYREHREFLDELTNTYGVPGQYLVAFWGLETNFGSYLGTMPTLDSLATLACDPRRSRFFTTELMTALKLLERESLTPEQMQGSWAGAMGHTQFMPSSYWRYAVDGDGDGQINLWASEKDALASGANFLSALGWKREERWGREVSLPESFPYLQTGLGNPAPLSLWHESGVRRADGSLLPVVDMEGAVLVPAGHMGPAFLVYDNFSVIMKWNRSESYAISVGHLADRIIGAGALENPPSLNQVALTRAELVQLQESLIVKGYEPGEPDGVMGPATRSAISAFQRDEGLIADGFPNTETLELLSLNFSKG